MTELDRVHLIRVYVLDHKREGWAEILTHLNEIEEALYRLEDIDK